MKTLVLGGYGNFGARICRALAGDPGIQLLVGGRDASRARQLAATLGGGAEGVAIDLAAPGFSDRLRQLGVELLIHTAGPFQGQSYDVARAAAQAGCHYIDLADGRRFVCDFPPSLDAAFRAAGRVGIAGASTVPALSSAVVTALTSGWRSLRSIDLCIAPAQTAPRGEATLAAVLSYCGEPIQVWDEGRWQPRRGWAQSRRVRFARMRPRLGALCDIPDLELFPARFGVTERVHFRAALEVGFTQRAMGLLAMLRRVGLLKRPSRLAGIIQATSPMFDRFGSGLGGMVLRVEGQDASGRPARREWHIAADDDHGPEIPCMAAILLARRLARGEALPIGAHACIGLLALADFQPEFDRWGMVTDLVTDEGLDGTSAKRPSHGHR
ncbi:saccharopine dehydrogenase NADP-binding domain-containing protein [Mitsuaria sp. GD03876]|uniref:saccharopine dehydrogenase family protein n=1 Tax=Mitsuaria sp. GD03876 TaxID=2975399 RepID=UPI002449BE8D|nr:saccharopine dehydrogenase NADP-binding domain-containing protein [Mitsuaria sp. GD03876]MDH0863357.1 saccharopine dehydrogenase NADP-binding domain-containing protein [Mitsuaria sp. GD03876]